mgnify:CR=1 FL=1
MVEFLIANFGALVFWVLALLAVAGAVGVVALRSPVHSALSLLWTFLVVAALFVLRHAEFLAAVQILVYGGGILVLFLFVIMLVNVRSLPPEEAFLSRLAPAAVLGAVLLGALIAAGLLLGVVATGDGADSAVLRTVVDPDTGVAVERGNTEAVGWLLYQKYLIPFEIVSVVLLVAMIGAIVFGRRDAALEGKAGRMEL